MIRSHEKPRNCGDTHACGTCNTASNARRGGPRTCSAVSECSCGTSSEATMRDAASGTAWRCCAWQCSRRCSMTPEVRGATGDGAVRDSSTSSFHTTLSIAACDHSSSGPTATCPTTLHASNPFASAPSQFIVNLTSALIAEMECGAIMVRGAPSPCAWPRLGTPHACNVARTAHACCVTCIAQTRHALADTIASMRRPEAARRMPPKAEHNHGETASRPRCHAGSSPEAASPVFTPRAAWLGSSERQQRRAPVVQHDRLKQRRDPLGRADGGGGRLHVLRQEAHALLQRAGRRRQRGEVRLRQHSLQVQREHRKDVADGVTQPLPWDRQRR